MTRTFLYFQNCLALFIFSAKSYQRWHLCVYCFVLYSLLKESMFSLCLIICISELNFKYVFTCDTVPEDFLEGDKVTAASFLQKLGHLAHLWIPQLNWNIHNKVWKPLWFNIHQRLCCFKYWCYCFHLIYYEWCISNIFPNTLNLYIQVIKF